MKNCKACGEAKSLDDFYNRDNACKECRKAGVRANRKAKLEYYRAYDRARSMKPSRVAARKAYAHSERGKLREKLGTKAWVKRNPEKRKAHIATGNAIRDGKLVRQPCEVCGTFPAEAHHDDYSKPLDVRWLCTKHHAEHHKNEREKERAA